MAHSLVDHEDVTFGSIGHVSGGRPEQTIDAAIAMAPEDDEVRVQFLADSEDCTPRLADAQDGRVDPEVRGSGG